MKPSPRQLVTAIAFAAIVLAATVGTASSAIKHTNGTFTVDLALSKPVATSPTTGTSLTYPNDPIKLTWQAVPGAATYEVQVAQQPNAEADCNTTAAWQSENILFTHATSDLGWVPELTSPETGSKIWTGTFCWRVRAAGATPGVWSTSNRFSVAWPATASNLRFYSDENGDIPRAGTADSTGFDTGYLEWRTVDGASRYEVQISEAPNFSASSMFATKTYFGNRLLLPQLPDNNYTWRVRPVASNGVRGNWSASATFTIYHDSRYWDNAATLSPTNGGSTNDLRIGWEPVPGASYYRYMVSTSSTFTNHDSTGPYGTPNDTCTGFYNSRLSSSSEADSSTVNNWVTAAGLLDPAVVANLVTYCKDAGSVAHRPNLPSTVYWRAYPVWRLSKSTESGWDVAAQTINGQFKQRSFSLVPYGAGDVSAGPLSTIEPARCESGLECLRLIGGSMSPLNSSTNSTTMQVPMFEWGAYDSPTGGFHVNVARDPNFNNNVFPAGQNQFRGWTSVRGPAKRDAWGVNTGLTRFGPINRSFAFTTGLPDEGQDGNGYFWRAIPCVTPNDPSGDNVHLGIVCDPHYTDDPDTSPGIVAGEPDSGALEFNKRVEVSTQVVNGFTDTVPMLRVGPVGASTFQQWQTGIQGADHYQFELARSAAFEDSREYKTTVPRIVPWGSTPDEPLEPGTWYWRVRAVDRDGLAGTWSASDTFSVNAQAPTPAASSATSGIGGVVEWSRVPGTVAYEIAWSSDASFNSGITSATTAQSAYFIPAATPGAFKWRVRAMTGKDAFGPWSEPKDIVIVAPTRISYGVSSSKVLAGSTLIAEAQLLVNGSPRNKQNVVLQRKGTSCTTAGRYARIASARTGSKIDDGFVRMRIRAPRSFCYRFVWGKGASAVYSASFEVKAVPYAAARVVARNASRGTPHCFEIGSRQPLNGRLRIQYRVGKAWFTARTEKVRRMTYRKQCAVINRGGIFPTRVLLDNLMNPTGQFKMYDSLAINTGTVRVADRFEARRS